MPNAFYDEELFDKYVAAKITDYTVVRRTVALRSHVSDSMGFTLGVSLDFLPDINKPSAFMMTPEGAFVASSPSIYDGYFSRINASRSPKWTIGTITAPTGSRKTHFYFAEPTDNLTTFDYTNVRDRRLAQFGVAITTQDGVFFPIVIGKAHGSSAPKPEDVTFLSGSVSPPSLTRVVSRRNNNSGSDTPKDLWEGSLPYTYFKELGLTPDTQRTQTVITRGENIYPYVTKGGDAISVLAHSAGYAAHVSVADDVPAGAYKIIFSNYLEGGAHALEPGHTRFEVNGGGYLPFTLPVERAPIVPYMRIRPILQPDVMTGSEGYTVQVAMLTKVAQYTKTKVNGVDTLDVEYDRVRSNINLTLRTYSDAWCTDPVASEHLPFHLSPMYKAEYSLVQPGFEVPTMRVNAVNEYHAIEFDVRRNVSDIAELQAVYISVELDRGFMPTVFVVEASKDGETWESMATLDIHYYQKAVDDARRRSRSNDLDIEPSYMKHHLVEVTRARNPSPAIIILREGVG